MMDLLSDRFGVCQLVLLICGEFRGSGVLTRPHREPTGGQDAQCYRVPLAA